MNGFSQSCKKFLSVKIRLVILFQSPDEEFYKDTLIRNRFQRTTRHGFSAGQFINLFHRYAGRLTLDQPGVHCSPHFYREDLSHSFQM